ncbi:MAG: diacylglycerol kinase [Gammaproteobacteria bacterium]
MKKLKGFRHFFHAFKWSLDGLISAFKGEAAFRQELILAGFLIPLGLYLGDGGVEKALLVFPVLLLLIVELVNTAIESVVDRIGTEKHELSKRAKDIGSAAVFLSVILLLIMWTVILTY